MIVRLLLRLKTIETETKETTPSSLKAPRGKNRVMPMNESPKNSTHMISPQKHCHQSPKLLRERYALTTASMNKTRVARYIFVFNHFNHNYVNLHANFMLSKVLVYISVVFEEIK